MIITLQKDGTLKRIYEEEDIAYIRSKIIKMVVLLVVIIGVAIAATIGGCQNV